MTDKYRGKYRTIYMQEDIMSQEDLVNAMAKFAESMNNMGRAFSKPTLTMATRYQCSTPEGLEVAVLALVSLLGACSVQELPGYRCRIRTKLKWWRRLIFWRSQKWHKQAMEMVIDIVKEFGPSHVHYEVAQW